MDNKYQLEMNHKEVSALLSSCAVLNKLMAGEDITETMLIVSSSRLFTQDDWQGVADRLSLLSKEAEKDYL